MVGEIGIFLDIIWVIVVDICGSKILGWCLVHMHLPIYGDIHPIMADNIFITSSMPGQRSANVNTKTHVPTFAKLATVLLFLCIVVTSFYNMLSSSQPSSQHHDEMDSIEESFNISKKEIRLSVLYVTIILVSLCCVIGIMFITEYLYFTCFGGYIFGHSHVNVDPIMKDIKEELVKIRANHQESMTDALNILKNILSNKNNTMMAINDAFPESPSSQLDSAPNTTLTDEESVSGDNISPNKSPLLEESVRKRVRCENSPLLRSRVVEKLDTSL